MRKLSLYDGKHLSINNLFILMSICKVNSVLNSL